MMTREEAYIIGESIKVPSMKQRSERIKEFINTVYDSFEQHIKSLESQLANNEQLTCEHKEHCSAYKFNKNKCVNWCEKFIKDTQ